MSKILSWGECAVFTRKAGESETWKKWDTPVENSTTINPTEGEKTEAKVEGGENEAVRKAKNTYQLQWEERIGADYTYVVDDEDGTIEGEYEVLVAPLENKTAPGLYIAKSELSTTPSYSSADGVKQMYTAEALKNDKKAGTKPLGQVALGTVTLGEDGLPTSFVPLKGGTNVL